MTDPEGLPRGLRLGRLLARTVLGAVLILAFVVGGTLFRVWFVARQDDRSRADVVVVLGAAQYDGRPSAVLEARLQHAVTLYESGVADHILTVGGRQAGDNYTEAEASEIWLVENGVPPDRVIAVGEGVDTLGSFRVSARAISDRGWDSAVIVSDPWHSLRARTMARDAGIDAWVSPTRRGPIVQTRETQARYIVRETAALLHYRLTHAPAAGDDNGLK
ncbi:uncharacterized SAM-binding protein YcdF (DUF218 family) [Actinoalloteichus hoggarensis]|uniref:Vancomycin high temperature exclusion protein n=1 Tax=Actinoalloteichus hoggarensis TaxID=1470176 RepID=A0A221W9T4_9PSEU|nr:YdcF family protein [Actinoalloteichus hoggarensis]ASO22087.1 vancomycin high temperature exclusion protein [Actinoalloteichus hoggarensis]MBB5923831.1 uncharacterized SAM-binding protein YcdF (DUF218 family) [Actinoalloteichus hoggarensis]